jgi:hypothetical protein
LLRNQNTTAPPTTQASAAAPAAQSDYRERGMNASNKTPWLSTDVALSDISRLTRELAAEPQARRRMKLARALAFAGSSLAEAGTPLELSSIESAIAALRRARAAGAHTNDLGRSLARLSKLRQEALGLDNASICAEQTRGIVMNAACLMVIGKPDPEPAIWCDPKQALLAINRGDFFLIATGFDGRIYATLRIIEGSEPILTTQEYAQLEYSTDIGHLIVTQRELRFGAPEDMQQGLRAPALNGWMKVQMHCLRRGSREHFVLVACRTDQGVAPLRDIPSIP